MEMAPTKPVSLRHALSLLRVAIVLHIASSGLALMGLLGVESRWRWLLVDGLAVIAILLLMRGLNAGNRWARWLPVPIGLMITTFVFPRMLLNADTLMLWVTMFQGVVQLAAAGFALDKGSAGWFADQ